MYTVCCVYCTSQGASRPALYVHMYVCMYVHTYIHTYSVCMYVCMNVRTYVCMYVCMYICVVLCMCICMYSTVFNNTVCMAWYNTVCTVYIQFMYDTSPLPPSLGYQRPPCCCVWCVEELFDKSNSQAHKEERGKGRSWWGRCGFTCHTVLLSFCRRTRWP